MSDVNIRGRFVWHELMTTDTEAAADFYAKVVGWSTHRWSPDSDYTLFVTPTGPMAGLMVLPEEAKAMNVPPNWMSYIGTPDVDATAQLAAQLGGEILRAPDDVPGVGRFAVLADPHGAAFGVMALENPSPDSPHIELGDFSWHELATSDWETAFDFYSDLFGWVKTESMDMGPGLGVYQMYGWKGRTIGGMFNKPASIPGPSYWMPYAKIPDAKLAANVITKASGQVINGPMEVPGGDWITQGIDPQGAVFSVHSVKAAAPVAAAPPAAKAPAKKAAAPARKAAVKAKPMRKAKAVRKAKPMKKAKPARKAKPAKKTKPSRMTKPMKKTKPSRMAKPVKQAMPTRKAKPVKQAKPTRKAKPVKKAVKKKSGARKKK